MLANSLQNWKTTSAEFTADIDFTGNLDTAIAIRIIYKKNGKIFVRSGAGIVADSVPEKEFEECLNKARACLAALETDLEGA